MHNPKCKSYISYGGRGIEVEESFGSFLKFKDWAISEGYTYDCKLEVDRINNDGNYSSENCRLVSREENLLNMRNINLTLEDVSFIRSEDFDVNNIPSNFKCKKSVILRILNYETFKNI